MKQKLGNFGLTKDQRKLLIEILEFQDNNTLNLKSILGLPETFKFGYEIEVGDVEWKKLSEEIKNFKPNYKVVSDSSIQAIFNDYGGIDDGDDDLGAEIITPILTDSEHTWQDIKEICDWLKIHNAKVLNTCSLHTNIGANILGNNYQYWYNLCKIIAACEPELYRYFARDKIIRTCAINGTHRNSFAMPIAKHLRIGLEKSSLEKTTNIAQLLNNCAFNGRCFSEKNASDANHQYIKNKSISLKGLYDFNRIDHNNYYTYTTKFMPIEDLNTSKEGRRIELRMSNGTTEPAIIQDDLYTTSRIIYLAMNLTTKHDEILDRLIEQPLEENYNNVISVKRIIDVANLLFDKFEEKANCIATCIKPHEKDIIMNTLNVLSREED